MIFEDVLVGAVAIGIGVFALFASVSNSDWPYHLWTARWVESRFGRRGARIFYAILGLILILFGAAIAVGFGPNRS